MQVIPPLEKALVIQQLPPAEAVTPANWPEALRSVCWLLPEMHEDASQRDALQALQRADGYESLGAVHRLELLRTLVESLYATFTVRERLRENETKQFELTRDFNAAAREREAAERSAEARETERAREAEAFLGVVINPHHAVPPEGEILPSAAAALAAAASSVRAVTPAAAVAVAPVNGGVVAAPQAMDTAEPAGAPPPSLPPSPAYEPDAEPAETEVAVPAEAAAASTAPAAEAAPAAPAPARAATAPAVMVVTAAPVTPSFVVSPAAFARPSPSIAMALLAAIAEREPAALEAAAALASAAGPGAHCGAEASGKKWLTAELQMARRVQREEGRRGARRARKEALAAAQAEATRAHAHAMAAVALRELPLGVDDHGRRYWAFARDPLRLWVEEATEAPPPPEGIVAQVVVPAGLKAGSRFQGSVAVAGATTSSRFEVVLPVGLSGGDTISVRLPPPPPPPPLPPPLIPSRRARAAPKRAPAAERDEADLFFAEDPEEEAEEATEGGAAEGAEGAEEAALARWQWAFFSNVDDVKRLVASLNGASARESRLKRALRARLGAEWSTGMVAAAAGGEAAGGEAAGGEAAGGEAAAAAAAGWRPSAHALVAHDLVGRRVLRRGEEAAVTLGWVSSAGDQEGAGGVRFCVVWEDGMEELMGQAEVELAVDAVRAAATAADEGSGLVTLPQPAYENSFLPLSGDSLGLEGARAELLELEGVLLPGLRKHIPGWEGGRVSPISKMLNKGKKEEAKEEEDAEQGSRRAEWLKATEQATAASELGRLLLTLEETVPSPRPRPSPTRASSQPPSHSPPPQPPQPPQQPRSPLASAAAPPPVRSPAETRRVHTSRYGRCSARLTSRRTSRGARMRRATHSWGSGRGASTTRPPQRSSATSGLLCGRATGGSAATCRPRATTRRCGALTATTRSRRSSRSTRPSRPSPRSPMG